MADRKKESESLSNKIMDLGVVLLVGSALVLGALACWFRYGTTKDLKEEETRD